MMAHGFGGTLLVISAILCALVPTGTGAPVPDTPYLQPVSTRYVFTGKPNPAAWPEVAMAGPVVASAADSVDGTLIWMISNTTLYAYHLGGAVTAVDTLSLGTPLRAVSEAAGVLAVVGTGGVMRCKSAAVQSTWTAADACQVFGAPSVKHAHGAVVTPVGDLWIAADSGIYFLGLDGTAVQVPMGSPSFVPPAHSVAFCGDVDSGFLAVGTHKALFLYDGDAWRHIWRRGVLDSAPKALVCAPAAGDLWIGDQSALDVLQADGTSLRFSGINRVPELAGLPYGNASDGTLWSYNGDEVLWLATSKGLVGRELADGTWHYYSGPRWHPGTEITAVAVSGAPGPAVALGASSGPTLVACTDTGIAEITHVSMTLEDKAAYYLEMALTRHSRMGLTGDCGLAKYGQLSSWFPTPSDNNGLWTAIYAISQAFRYAATGDPAAKADAWTAFEGLELLNNVTNIRGYMARSVWPYGENAGSGLWWNATGAYEGKLQFKGDTSSDEVTGHMAAYTILYDLVAETPSEKARVERLVVNIVDGLIDNDWLLVGVEGNRTTWGVWSPEYLNDIYSWRDERGLNSLQVLTYLLTAYKITGSSTYLDEWSMLTTQHGYLDNVVNTKITWPSDDNFSDDELGFVPYLAYFYMDLPYGQKEYGEGIGRLFQQISMSKCAAWNYIYSFATPNADPSLLQDAAWQLRNFPTSFINWQVDNSQRHDLEILPDLSREGTLQSVNLIPYDEQDLFRLNGNPYSMNPQGNGMTETDPGAWLLSYWSGRYMGFLAAPVSSRDPRTS